jgi:hypothetical protein
VYSRDVEPRRVEIDRADPTEASATAQVGATTAPENTIRPLAALALEVPKIMANAQPAKTVQS